VGFYVYLHKKKTTGEVFYVGKGKKKRAWDFVQRSQFWKHVYEKHGVEVVIYENNLQEWYAYELEKDLIALYGRLSDGKGCLVNLTDGGVSAVGTDCGNSDKKVYNFYQYETGESFKGTRVAFSNKYGIDPAPLFYKKSDRVDITIKGWIKYDNEIPKKIRTGFAGELNPTADKAEYNFINSKTGEVFVGTRVSFKERYNVRTTNMFKVGVGEKNWYCIEKTPLENLYYAINGGRPNPNADDTIYTLENEDGTVFVGTRVEFTKKTGLQPLQLFCKNPQLSYRGWFLQENKETLCRSRNDWDVYKFVNIKTGEEMIATRRKFVDKYPDVAIHHIFNKTSFSINGWTIPEFISEEELRKTKEGRAGNNHHATDQTIYRFINLKTSETFEGSRQDLKKKVGKPVNDLFRKSRKPRPVQGWFFEDYN